MLYSISGRSSGPTVNRTVSPIERAIFSLLMLFAGLFILGWLASLPAIGLPSESVDDSTESSKVSKTAIDLGEPLFPDYYTAPFTAGRLGSDQPFSLIPVQPEGIYEAIMELPPPPDSHLRERSDVKPNLGEPQK